MKTYWQTFAIVNAIWSVKGEVDWGSLVHVALVGWSLWRIFLAEKADRTAANPTDKLAT